VTAKKCFFFFIFSIQTDRPPGCESPPAGWGGGREEIFASFFSLPPFVFRGTGAACGSFFPCGTWHRQTLFAGEAGHVFFPRGSMRDPSMQELFFFFPIGRKKKPPPAERHFFPLPILTLPPCALNFWLLRLRAGAFLFPLGKSAFPFPLFVPQSQGYVTSFLPPPLAKPQTKKTISPSFPLFWRSNQGSILFFLFLSPPRREPDVLFFSLFLIAIFAALNFSSFRVGVRRESHPPRLFVFPPFFFPSAQDSRGARAPLFSPWKGAVLPQKRQFPPKFFPRSPTRRA